MCLQGYSRKGAALFQLGRLEEAETAYKDGLMKDSSNSMLKTGLEEVKAKRGWFLVRCEKKIYFDVFCQCL